MLDIRAVDLVALAEALSDHTDEHTWWFDPRTGQLELGVDGATPASALETDRLIPVDPWPSGVIRRDIQEFLDGLQDADALVRLQRAAEGGDGRAFTEAVAAFPELRLRWREFVDERRQRRAVQWLADEGVVTAAQVDKELAERRAQAAPGEPRPPTPAAVAADAAAALAPLYGERLRQVLPTGAQLEVLVVLDRLDSVWTELARMEPAMWALGVAAGADVTAYVVSEDQLRTYRPHAGGSGGAAVPSRSGPAAISEELAAARALLAAGLPRPAVAHALAAAAEAAGLTAIMPAATARVLRSLTERGRAARVAAEVPTGEAARAVADAEVVVRALAWPTPGRMSA